MAIYHFNLKQISKGKGQSACQHASYIAGEPIRSEALDITYNNKKPEVMYSNILLCKNAPEEYKDRETLWNAVEKIEKQKNAQLARSIILALPNELTLEQKIELTNNFVQKNFVNKGMIADINIHDKGDGNPHAHIMLTMREIDENGEWKKKRNKSFKLDDKGERIPIMDKRTGAQKLAAGNRKQWEKNDEPVNNWNKKETLVEWRSSWAEEQNAYLDKDNQVDHRSLSDQGIDREPTRHVGYKKGAKNERILAQNAEIKQANKNRQEVHVIAAQAEDAEEEVNQLVRVTTLKGQLENQTLTEMEDTENGDNGTDGERPGRRARLFPAIGTGSVAVATATKDAGEDFEEFQRRTMAAISQTADSTIGATAAENITAGKTISGFDLGAIRARNNIATAERANRDAVQQGQDPTGKITSDRENQKRITDFTIKYGIDDRQSEKDDRQFE